MTAEKTKVTFPVSRKEHNCDGCGNEIKKGEKYHRKDYLIPADKLENHNKDQAGWHSFKLCSSCSTQIQGSKDE